MNYVHTLNNHRPPPVSRPSGAASISTANATTSSTNAIASTKSRRMRQISAEERQRRREYMRKYNQKKEESDTAQQVKAERRRMRREKEVRLELVKRQYSGDIEAVVPVILDEIAKRRDRIAGNAGKRPGTIRSIVGDVLATLHGYGPAHLESFGTTAGTSAAPEVPVPPVPPVAAAPVAVATATSDDSSNSAVSPLTEANRKASQNTELPIADDNVDLFEDDNSDFPAAGADDDDSHDDKCNQSCDGVSCPNDSNAADNACADADGHAHEEATSVPVVKISRKDGDSEVVYRKNPIYVGSLHKGGEIPRFIGEAKEVSSGKTMHLPHHPSTNDPYLPKRVAKHVSSRVKRPDGDVAHRVEIVDGDAGDSHLATVVWVPYEVLDKNIKSTVGLDDEAWPCGTAKETFCEAYKKVRDHEMFGKSGKPSASGEYAEAGYGTGSGSQSTSIKVSTAKGQTVNASLPYLRNPCFTTDVEASLGNSMGIITQYLKEEEPDLLQGLRENGDGTINRALTYPRPDPSGPLRSAPTILTNQVATRLVGCPKDGHINDKRKLQSQYGGSGLHVDSGDPDSKTGSLTIYICFDYDADPNASQNRRKFKYSDLAIFQKKTGGRAAVIETMQPGFVCLVFHHPSRHLHGSVFPNKDKPQPLTPGCEGMKVVCYQVCFVFLRRYRSVFIYLYHHLYSFITLFLLLLFQSKQILKLAEHCHANEDVFDHYVQEHDEFRRGVQRKGQTTMPFATLLLLLGCYRNIWPTWTQSVRETNIYLRLKRSVHIIYHLCCGRSHVTLMI